MKRYLADPKVRFLLVGGFCFVLTMAINYGLKYTVLTHKPTSALIIATAAASFVSYILSSRWTWEHSSGKARPREFVGFIVVTVLGIIVNAFPQWVSRYVFHIEQPHVSFLIQEAADFIAGPILGTILAMFFRYWALDRFVFHGKKARQEAQITETLPANTGTFERV
ncbi:GtrA family protein [Rothia sp. ZJ1223]|uniref:GtrA family protein n=1 Tax=Rothia sp. ZJ1223 TaxID=2811098 RepID=UPI0021079B0D|nr:GtrA family protein [Rothia sp. ZJ1223]